ncbi:MAG TPA: hypothetical protein VEA37_03275 [Flavobacterium sp.]|nr:hypothetical protein [Flavobacterium sp.]
MKIEITTNPKLVELANYILAQAVDSLEKYPKTRKQFNITPKEVKDIEVFRKQLVKGFTETISK